jgi:hypothetical protein
MGAAACLTAMASAPASAADITLNIVDPPNVGFNDPTPVAPVGGNAGTTLGEQRRIVFETAASIWEAALTPNVDIVIQSSFAPLACTPTGAVLGSAGTIQIFANFDNAGWPNTWYHSALANHLAGEDQTPGPPDPGLLVPPFNDDIVAFFNGDIGVNPNCLVGTSWYNGLDNQATAAQIDLLNVVLHEFSHGLGFSAFRDRSVAGDAVLGLSDVYRAYSYDNEFGLFWNQMDKRQRAVSTVNDPNLVWRGPNVSAQVPVQLSGLPVVRVTAPGGIAGDYTAQTASYGLPLDTPPGDTGEVVLFNDAVGPDPNDACDAFDPGVAGKIALINRGTCTFALKSAVAQISGAVGVIIVNNAPTGLPPMGGADLIPPTISSVGITMADGDLLKANLPGVVASLVADPALGFSGADADGFAKLYAPAVFAPGSSVSHWDITLTPNALMEPFINSDLKGATTLDLTPYLMRDIGWSGGPHCPVGADDRALVEVGSCATGVANTEGPFGFSLGVPRTQPELPADPNGNAEGIKVFGGCHVQDMVNACEKQGGPGEVGSCLGQVTKYLERIEEISKAQGAAIRACAKE